MNSIKVCEYSRSRSFHDDLILQNQASGERSEDQWSSGSHMCSKSLYYLSEFIPYVFQILSLLIELHKDSVPETYMQLFPHLLTPLLWERPGNIPPLVRLLQAFIEKGAKQIEPEKLVSCAYYFVLYVILCNMYPHGLCRLLEFE